MPIEEVMTHSRALRLLDLEPGATAAEIKLAYRDLVRVWHPDRFESDPRLRARAASKLADVNAAYRLLTDPASTKAAAAGAPSSMPDRRKRPRPASTPPVAPAPKTSHRTAGIAAVAAMLLAAVALTGLPSRRVGTPAPPVPAAAGRDATPLVTEPIVDPAPPAPPTAARPTVDAVRPRSPFSRDLDRALARASR